MLKRNLSLAQRSPKRVIPNKAKLIIGPSSPTVSPLKKIKRIFLDKYTVIDPEKHSNLDNPNNKLEDIEGTRKFNFYQQKIIKSQAFNIITEAANKDTPVVVFMPKRPKRFYLEI